MKPLIRRIPSNPIPRTARLHQPNPPRNISARTDYDAAPRTRI